MSKLNLSQIAKSVQVTVSKHSPEILMGIGIAGMLTTTILAVRSTPKALRLIDEKKEEMKTEKLAPIDTVKTCWKCYIPAAVTASLSVACLISANSVNVRRNAALATAYALSETALKEYQEKVVETIGEKKEQVVHDAIAKDKVERNPVSTSEVIITEKGNTLCYDTVSGRYFKSDIEKLKQAANELNFRLRDEMYISVNDFYYEIGLKSISIGDDIGWNIDKGYINLKFSSQLADDGTPCLVLSYGVGPRYDYRSLM